VDTLIGYKQILWQISVLFIHIPQALTIKEQKVS